MYKLSCGGNWDEITKGVVLPCQGSVNVTHSGSGTVNMVLVGKSVLLVVPKQS